MLGTWVGCGCDMGAGADAAGILGVGIAGAAEGVGDGALDPSGGYGGLALSAAADAIGCGGAWPAYIGGAGVSVLWTICGIPSDDE